MASSEESWAPKNWCFWTIVLEKTLESPLYCKEIQPVHPKGDQSWVFIGRTDAEAGTPNTLATSCEELTHWKRPWFWEGLGAGGEGDSRGWEGWMASPTRRAWVWVNSGSLWWTGRPGVLWFIGSQRVGYDWVTELNWSIIHSTAITHDWSYCFHIHIYPNLDGARLEHCICAFIWPVNNLVYYLENKPFFLFLYIYLTNVMYTNG